METDGFLPNGQVFELFVFGHGDDLSRLRIRREVTIADSQLSIGKCQDFATIFSENRHKTVQICPDTGDKSRFCGCILALRRGRFFKIPLFQRPVSFQGVAETAVQGITAGHSHFRAKRGYRTFFRRRALQAGFGVNCKI